MTDQITPSPGDVPRAAEPPEITPVQYALLDALRDVALSAEAPSAEYAGREAARLAAAAFGYPLPQREGGLASVLYGRPVTTDDCDGSCEAAKTLRRDVERLRQANKRLHAALRADVGEVVAELHSSEPGVSNGVPANVCRECLKVWPCPTARAVQALTETTEGGEGA